MIQQPGEHGPATPTLERVQRLLAETLGVAPELVQPSTTPIELGAQSFDFAEFALRLERAFEVVLPRSCSIPNLLTVAAYLDAIEHARHPALKGSR